jgi:chromosome segregation ATPase
MAYDERFDHIDAGIGDLKGSVSELRGSVSELRGSVSELKGSVSELRDSLAQLTRYVLDFREETIRHFEVIDNRLDVLSATVANIETRYPALSRAILDFGTIATRLTNEQARQKHTTAELAEKLSKIVNPAA